MREHAAKRQQLHIGQPIPNSPVAGRINVEGADSGTLAPDEIERLIASVFEGEHVELSEITVVFLSDEEIRTINNRHLNHDYPTDVISFTISDEGEPVEGEIYVGYETAAANASEYGENVKREIMRVIAHGALHLAGYDDKSPEESSVMRAREDEYMKSIAGDSG